MIFSYNWLQDYIKGKLPSPKKLAELLTMHSFEVENLKEIPNHKHQIPNKSKITNSKFKTKDWVLDIDVLPNRAHDCLSHIGIAREIAAILNLKLNDLTNIATARNVKLREDKKLKAKDFVAVEIENKEDCPRYTAKVIFDVRVGTSPKWMQERLRVCGLQSINNIVDIANYVMLEMGQPIHTFDLDKLKSMEIPNSKFQTPNKSKNQNLKFKTKKIIVRRAKKGEKIKTLDGKTYELNKDVLVIADLKKVIGIAGTKGGESTGIDYKTKNVIIEAANFDQRVVRQGSRKLKLKTDASWRFENGIDPNLIDFAQERIASLIQELAGGKTAQGMVDFYPKKVLPKKIRLDLDYVEKLLGLKISKQKVLKILKNLGFQCLEIGEIGFPNIVVGVPTRRLDVLIQEDLIEEVGRIFGYQNIPSVFPQAALIPPERSEELSWERIIIDVLKEAGFCEVYNYSFIGEKEKEICGWGEVELVELENPTSSFNKFLRPSLISNLLRNIKENLRFSNEIKIFELGKVFTTRSFACLRAETHRQARLRRAQDDSNVVSLEKKMLAGVLVRKGIRDEGFYELKGIVDLLLNKLGISNIWYDDYQPTPEESHLEVWHPRKCAEIKTDGEELGFLGEIHPKIIEDLSIEERVFIFDLNFEKLIRLASEEQTYQPISSYPASLRDLAVLVPQGTKVVTVLNKIQGAGGELVRDVDLFDFYIGEELPEDKENLAFHIIYQAEDRTLSSKEIDEVHQRIIKALEEKSGWEVRR